jgi:hypothetical protein
MVRSVQAEHRDVAPLIVMENWLNDVKPAVKK